MNSKIKELAEQAGFCFWSDESWKPEGAVIDWASNYDEAFERFVELLHQTYGMLIMEHAIKWHKDGEDLAVAAAYILREEINQIIHPDQYQNFRKQL